MKHGITIWLIAFYLTLVFILICGLTAKSEVMVSIYHSDSDVNKSVIECTLDNGKDIRLIVENEDLESDGIVKWFDNNCMRTK